MMRFFLICYCLMTLNVSALAVTFFKDNLN